VAHPRARLKVSTDTHGLHDSYSRSSNVHHLPAVHGSEEHPPTQPASQPASPATHNMLTMEYFRNTHLGPACCQLVECEQI
jgi:hypothetical protein